MMVGYANEHAAGTYRVYMLRTGRFIETRDVFWLDMYYGQWLNGDDSHDLAESSRNDDDSDNDDESEVFVYEHDDPKDDNDDEDSIQDDQNKNDSDTLHLSSISDDNGSIYDSDDDDKNTVKNSFDPYRQQFLNTPATRAARYASRNNNNSEVPYTDDLIRELQRLDTSYNPTLENIEDRSDFAMIHASIIDYGLHSAVSSGYLESVTYKEMLKRPETERKLWLAGCSKEFDCMSK